MDDIKTIISLRGVSVSQDENVLFRNLDLDVGHGDFLYLIGPVGSGKSSLLKSLYAEVPLHEGTGIVCGFELRKLRRRQLPRLRRKIGIIFQDFQLLYNMTAHENLDFVLRATGKKDRRERDKRIAEVLEDVGMANKGYKRPHELSGGEQQRIAIARALLGHPELILADEPTGNLDTETGLEITQLLHRIAQQEGAAVLMATHNERMLQEFPGRVLTVGDQLSVTGKSQTREIPTE